jgi:hypothetical protein
VPGQAADDLLVLHGVDAAKFCPSDLPS